MDLKTKFNLIVSKMSSRAISETFDIGKKGAVKLKKGESARIDSDKLINFLNKK